MEEANEEVCIALQFGWKGKKKKKSKNKAETVAVEAEDSARAVNDGSDPTRVRISLFDYSAENFFRDMDTIAKLCGEEDDAFEQSEIQRLSSSVTFLREWRHFNYQPKSIRFACGLGSSDGKDVSCINLPQFSSATVPKESQLGDAKSQESRDFVMYVGGPVWAIDWCPRIHEKPDCSIKCEFIAVAAHPPGASYHKMGAPLTGRGVIQIWCLLNISENNEEVCPLTEKRKKRPKTDGGTNDKSTQIKKPRGRPRKYPIEKAVDDMNCETQYVPALAVQFPENSAEFLAPNGNHENNEKIDPPTDKRKRGPKKNESTNEKSAQIKRPRGRPKKNSKELTMVDPNCENQSAQALVGQVPEDSAEFLSLDVAHGNCNEYASQQDSGTKRKHAKKSVSACNNKRKTPIKKCRLKANPREERYNQDISLPLLTQYEDEENHQPHCSSELDPLAATCSIPGDITLPRVVSCLAHNGKVAWDVKWRPPNMTDSICKHRMGYLAVLLGNGSLEVWEVPLPRVLRAIYLHRETTDPRFIKLEPIFKCSMLKRGGLQSIPLTVEWSASPPHDYLLAGCHDGTVALWKFSTNSSSKCDDTKPLLCFSGDTVPIRAVAWAPFEGDPESSNIILTAGHEGLKFWDLRNPFRPLRKLHPVPRIIYSLDWLSNPSCIIMSFEDGTMRTLSLVKAANDLPVSGKKYSGKKQPGLHGSSYSSSAIWSVQVSRITGMVAYCGADGTVIRFQLTTKAVETDHSRNRAPHFLCGSVTEEDSTLIINTPLSNTPFPLRKPFEKSRHALSSFRGFLAESNLSKSADNQMEKTSNSDSRTLALRDGDDLGLGSGSEEALSSVERPKKPKLSRSNKKKSVDNQAPVCRDDESTSTVVADNEKSDVGSIPEVFPPKMVALHRVRWNMNKGSERWLCYGGAGGIVRCQEIAFSDIDKKRALKR